MDYCEWVEDQRDKTPTIVSWESIPAEQVTDPKLTTHKATARKTWVHMFEILDEETGQLSVPFRDHANEFVGRFFG